MERDQNYGITVLHPKGSSENDILFECVAPEKLIYV